VVGEAVAGVDAVAEMVATTVFVADGTTVFVTDGTAVVAPAVGDVEPAR